jgi:hypothetical protein
MAPIISRCSRGQELAPVSLTVFGKMGTGNMCLTTGHAAEIISGRLRQASKRLTGNIGPSPKSGIKASATDAWSCTTDRYCDLVKEAANLGAQSAIVDGEIIVLNEAGLSHFGELRKAITGSMTCTSWLSICSISMAMICARGHRKSDGRSWRVCLCRCCEACRNSHTKRAPRRPELCGKLQRKAFCRRLSADRRNFRSPSQHLGVT